MTKVVELLEEAVRLLKEKLDAVIVELSTLNPGETFKIGEHDFIVLAQEEGQTKVISKWFMAENIKFDSDCRDYNVSNLKKIIETDIQPIIEAEVGADNLIEHEVDLISVDMQQEFESCKCKVRPITFDEAREFNSLLVNEDLDDWWWTCTPWSTKERGWEYSLAVVSSSGNFNIRNCNNCHGVRPFCILKSNIFVSKGE